jgi:Zn-dependent peptidase ImmA (M78 family)
MPTYQVTTAKCENVFRKVRNILDVRKQYCIENGNLTSVDDLLYVVEQAYGIKITRLDVAFDGKFLRGVCERYGDGNARILVRADQSEAEKRYVAVKELSHVIIDEKEDWSPQGESTISQYVMTEQMSGLVLASAEINSEALAQAAAIELLMPFDIRKDDARLVSEKKQTFSSLGLIYGLPPHIVAYAISEDYTKFSTDIWGGLANG